MNRKKSLLVISLFILFALATSNISKAQSVGDYPVNPPEDAQVYPTYYSKTDKKVTFCRIESCDPTVLSEVNQSKWTESEGGQYYQNILYGKPYISSYGKSSITINTTWEKEPWMPIKNGHSKRVETGPKAQKPREYESAPFTIGEYFHEDLNYIEDLDDSSITRRVIKSETKISLYGGGDPNKNYAITVRYEGYGEYTGGYSDQIDSVRHISPLDFKNPIAGVKPVLNLGRYALYTFVLKGRTTLDITPVISNTSYGYSAFTVKVEETNLPVTVPPVPPPATTPTPTPTPTVINSSQNILPTPTILPNNISTYVYKQSTDQEIPQSFLSLTFATNSSDVVTLQNYLISYGYLSEGSNSGYYGPLTSSAVAKYLADHSKPLPVNTPKPLPVSTPSTSPYPTITPSYSPSPTYIPVYYAPSYQASPSQTPTVSSSPSPAPTQSPAPSTSQSPNTQSRSISNFAQANIFNVIWSLFQNLK